MLSTSHYLGEIAVRRTTFKCTGILACQYASKAVSQSHTSWTIEDWKKKQEATCASQVAYLDEWKPWSGQKKVLEYVLKTFTKYF